MNSIRQALVLIIMTFVGLSLFVGCSSKPSNSEIEEAVKKQLYSNVPGSWVGNVLKGENAKISTVEIQEWGSFNKEQKYWPVKIRVTGSAEFRIFFNKAKVRQFDKVSEYRIYKDDYGKWKANLS